MEIWEAGDYPRHRVCGEFVCGDGVRILRQLDVLPNEDFFQPETVRFFTRQNKTERFQIPGGALSVSRFVLDRALAGSFLELGGRLRVNSRWTGAFSQEGLVRASGRRIAPPGNHRLIGIKVHAADFPLSADLELHFSSEGYIGISKLPHDAVNICALIRSREPFANIRENFCDRLAALVNSESRALIRNSCLDSRSLCFVAGPSFGPDAPDCGECRIGDSLRMISPLTENGMSLAFESAHIATPILESYSQGLLDWQSATRRISRMCETAFKPRLRFSSFLQNCLFSCAAQSVLRVGMNTIPALFPSLFRATRS